MVVPARYDPRVNPYPMHPSPAGAGQFTTPRPRRDPVGSLAASFFIPGLGSILNTETGRGFLIMALWVLSLGGVVVSVLLGLFVMSAAIFLVFPALGVGVALWIWGMVDAYSGAKRFNAQRGLV